MKKHSIYRWFRHVATLSGIPALTILFACADKYGMPNDVIWGRVLDKENNQPVPEVLIQDENSNQLAITDEYGQFQLTTANCKDFTFTKENYQPKDTTLCPTLYDVPIVMQKQSAE